ncbi:MAG TPA: TraR/DksA C4-type zinc finger protein [Burkholderiales bacterium]|nr:TraR/DksA C4-type zinc finger protein [Burkholderiales bacterium]
MTNLTTASITELERLLEERAIQLWREVEEYRDGASGKHEAAAAATERDQADLAFVAAAATIDRIQLQRDIEELRDIEAAQARIRNGVYGECIDCGESVGYQRLQAWPTAERCRDCQHDHERRPRGRTRSLSI